MRVGLPGRVCVRVVSKLTMYYPGVTGSVLRSLPVAIEKTRVMDDRLRTGLRLRGYRWWATYRSKANRSSRTLNSLTLFTKAPEQTVRSKQNLVAHQAYRPADAGCKTNLRLRQHYRWHLVCRVPRARARSMAHEKLDATYATVVG